MTNEPKTFDPDTFTKDSREIWSRAAPHYDPMSARLFREASTRFVQFAGIRPGDRVLDVACGTGMATIAAARAAGPSGRVTGADFSGEMLKFARQNAAADAAVLATVEFRETNAEAMDLPSGSFDAVICQLGLMLFARPKKAVFEMGRVVKPGGRVACLVQGDPAKMIFTSLLNKTMVRHAPHLKIPGAPTIYDFAPAGVLEKTLEEAGLANVRAERVEGAFEFASPQEYWDLMAAGAGRTGIMIKSLDPDVRRKVQDEVFAKASEFKSKNGVAIPYELVMAVGVRPS